MRNMMLRMAAIPLLVACSQPFDPPSKINDLRILAIRADLPEAAPGELVTLDALVVDPTGPVVPATMVWFTCVPDQFGGVDACAAGEGLLPTSINTPNVTVEIPADIPLFPPESPEAQSTILVALLACTDADPTRCFTCDAEAGTCSFGGEGVETEFALKRITVSNRPDEARNHNPVLAEFSFSEDNGQTFSPLPSDASLSTNACDGMQLRTLTTEESFESFVQLQFGEPIEITEELRSSFFVSSGAVDANQIFNDVASAVPLAADNGFSRDAEPVEELNVFVVLRDDRGGVDFASRTLSLLDTCEGVGQ